MKQSRPEMLCKMLKRVSISSLMLVSCQPLPRPFINEHDNPLLSPLKNADIVIEEVAGLMPDQDRALRNSLSVSLRSQGFLTSLGPGNRASFRMRGSAVPGLSAQQQTVNWQLHDASGRLIREFSTSVNADAADAIALWLPQASGEGRAMAQPKEQRRATGSVRDIIITGAPGDGDTALRHALALALRLRDVSVYTSEGATIEADVSVSLMIPDQEQVDIIWTVRHQNGTELGRVTQSNIIPFGLLRRRWGQVALAAADGAAGGIAPLLDTVSAASDLQSSGVKDSGKLLLHETLARASAPLDPPLSQQETNAVPHPRLDDPQERKRFEVPDRDAATPEAPGKLQYRLQFGAFRSESAAQIYWSRLAREQADLLNGFEMYLQRPGVRSSIVRVQTAPPVGFSEAADTCSQFHLRGVTCIIAQP